MAEPTKNTEKTFSKSAYGGDGWLAREQNHINELGTLWSDYSIDSEWQPLKAVLLHEPGDELKIAAQNPEAALMLDVLDLNKAIQQHQNIAAAYRKLDIEVHYVDPKTNNFPNQMFCADQLAMTPQGAILARPAGQTRAGEERWVARKLADLGIPILKTLTGNATFEGADLIWLNNKTVMIGHGHRTNKIAIEQITQVLTEIDCQTLPVDLPFGTMHFMGMLRIADKDLAVCWPRRTPYATVIALRELGYKVIFPPCEDNADSYRAMNFVTLSPRKILLAAGLGKFKTFFESHQIECIEVNTDELSKAAGNMGCLTSILSRQTNL